MASSVINFATIALGQIQQAYDEGNYLGDLQGRLDGYAYDYKKGQKTWRYPYFTKRTPQNSADSSASDLSPGSATETVVDIGCDTPLKLNDYLTYDQINDYGGFIPAAWTARFGRDMGEARCNRIAAYVGAISLAGGSTTKLVQALSADADALLGLSTLIAQYQADKIPLTGITVLVKPTSFQRLMRNASFASTDYNQDGTKGKPGDRIYMGVRVRPCASVFGLDYNNTTLYPGTPTKYKADFTNVWALAWQGDALQIVESETMGENNGIVEVPEREGYLIRTRMEFGMGALQTGALKCLVTS
ncbi:MAG: hypothetical protein ACREJO_00090 [Phycisphaerales bacterium]